MSGNTDFWHNDPFTQTDLPFPGNNLFGANRVFGAHPEKLAGVQPSGNNGAIGRGADGPNRIQMNI